MINNWEQSEFLHSSSEKLWLDRWFCSGTGLRIIRLTFLAECHLLFWRPRCSSTSPDRFCSARLWRPATFHSICDFMQSLKPFNPRNYRGFEFFWILLVKVGYCIALRWGWPTYSKENCFKFTFMIFRSTAMAWEKKLHATSQRLLTQTK